MIGYTRRGLNIFVLAFAIACLGLPQPGFAEKPAAGAASKNKGRAPTIFAAASLKTALDAVAEAWTAQTGKSPPIVYTSSGTLAKQIEQGAPADIFISADTNWMEYLEKAKLIRPGTRRNLLGNALVLIEPADSNTDLKIAPGFDLAGATGDGKIAVCTITSCPGGIYAKQALQKLGVWGAVEPKLAQADNIRNALNLVARGEAQFGIVYATDAKAEPKVKVIGVFPEDTHSPIVYPVGIVDASKNPEAARFVAFMTSQAATKIFTDQGFTILSK